MSSVLVKGMEMPDNCYHCKIAESCGHYIANYTDRRHPDCPLIALPDHHGRLVDADALEKEGWSLHRTIRVDMNTEEYQTKPLRQVPTIEPRCETCEAFNKTRLLIPQPERKKGQWIKHIDDLFPAESTIECNECHHEQPLTIDSNFCPNCGIEMCSTAEIARDIVHQAIDNSTWSETVDTAKMHKAINDKYAEMTEETE